MKRVLIITILLSSLCSFAQVGIGTTTPLSTLDINGNLSVKHVLLPVIPTDFTRQIIDDGVYISVSPVVNNQDFQLPDPRNFPGRVYIIRNIQNAINADITMDPVAIADGILFFAGDSSVGIPGPVNMDTAALGSHRNKTLIFISDGSNRTYGILGF
jgi:hypothetical protein